jgi:hypothetical protein
LKYCRTNELSNVIEKTWRMERKVERIDAIEKGAIHLLSTQTKDSMLSLIHYDKNTNENRRVLFSPELDNTIYRMNQLYSLTKRCSVIQQMESGFWLFIVLQYLGA